MSLDYFDHGCKEPARTERTFGLCDKQNGEKAYSDDSNQADWIAIVKNTTNKEVVFTPIDYCIIIHKAGTKDDESTCDGMLTFKDSIYLVELMDRRSQGWVKKAIEQFKNTIRLIRENQSIGYKYKKAFACNKRRRTFTTIDNERSKRFFKETDGFILDAQAEIIIK